MPSVKASLDEIDEGSQRALAEAVGNLDAVDAQSVAGLVDAMLDATISSRSSHDWDPNGTVGTALDATVSSRSSHDWDPDGTIAATLDAAVSTRSSHQWDPQGRIDAAVTTRSSHQWDPDGYIDQAISAAGASQSDIKAGAQDALAEKISNLDAVDGTSVAGLLDAYLNAAISSRSSHDWDPNGTVEQNLDAPVSSAGGATQSEVEEAVNNAAINNDIYRAIERRVSQIWETSSEIGTWTLSTGVSVASDRAYLPTNSQVFEDSNSYGTSSTSFTTLLTHSIDVTDLMRLTVYINIDGPVINGTPQNMSSRVVDATNSNVLAERLESTDYSEYSATYDVSGLSGTIDIEWRIRADAGENSALTRAEVGVSAETGRVESPLVGPPNTEWDVVNFDATPDGGSVAVDVVDGTNATLLTDATDGGDLGSISASKQLRLTVTLSRSSISADPSLNRGILRWID